MTPRQGEWSLVGEDARQRIRERIAPLARLLSALGLSADALTVAGLIVSLAAAVICATGLWLLAGIAVVAGAAFDLFDGAVARVRGTVSPFGGFLDSTFDRLGEGAVYVGVIAGVLGPGAASVTLPGLLGLGGAEIVAVLAAAALVGSQMVSYTRARAQGIGLEAAVGVAPRPERIALITVGLVLQPFVGWALGAVLGIVAVLSLVTVGQRVRHVRSLSGGAG
jgi:CDP-diacylglycerol--glycerol-3-phosphate 3-phosphatidyltransferase